jgi:hypothetical protein
VAFRVLEPFSFGQKKALTEILNENYDPILEFKSFCELLLVLFEDIPGFETAGPTHALMTEIWTIYNEHLNVRPSTTYPLVDQV